MRAILVQLPVPSFFPERSAPSSNIPLAAAALAAAAPAAGLVGRDSGLGFRRPATPAADRRNAVGAEGNGIELLSLDPAVADFGGDAAVAAAVADARPDLVAFTLYLWNVERSFAIAGRVRALLPDCAIVAGGPELAEGSIAWEHARAGSAIDVFVVGEGEEPFERLLAALASEAGRSPPRDAALARATAVASSFAADRPVLRATASLDLSRVRNPYLAGILAPERSGQLLLETTRGCPFRCSYCFYGKASGPVRRFPESTESAAFRAAAELGAGEVYVMDPSFNASAGLESRLEAIASANVARLPVHAELKPESVTPRIAGLMREAGFRSAEIGLQSSNQAALDAVNRPFERERFSRGVEALLDAGVRATTGLILGLPRDGLADVEATLDFVDSLGLADGAELYPLSLLPGTTLRGRAAEFGLRFDPKPPYWVRSTPDLDEAALADAIARFEERFGVEYRPPLVPRFDPPLDPPDGRRLASTVDARSKATGGDTRTALRDAVERPERFASSIAFLFDATGDFDAAAALPLRAAHPSAAFAFVLDARARSGPLSSAVAALDRLAARHADPEAWLARERRLSPDAQGRPSSRAFVVASDGRRALEVLADERRCDLILAPLVPPGADPDLDEAASFYPPIVLDPKELGGPSPDPDCAAAWRSFYADFPSLVI